MKKILFTIIAILLLVIIVSPAKAYDIERKGHFRVGLYAPGLFAGNEHINAMPSFGGEGEYFFLERLSASFRIEEATDFKVGDPPHSVLTFVARARYTFDLGTSGRWIVYAQGGGGGGLIGSRYGCGDIAIPGGGIWYQWDKNWSFGADTSLHILVRDNTAVGFSLTPAVRYQF